MVELNKTNKLPSKLKWYILVRLILIIFVPSFLLYLLNKDLGKSIFVFLFFFPVLPAFLYFWLYYNILNFVVDNDKITINSGILIKRSKSIPFNQVQNVDIVRGLLQRIFGLCKVNIWTSSVGQIRFHEKETIRRPDGILDIYATDGEWLKNFILNKHS